MTSSVATQPNANARTGKPFTHIVAGSAAIQAEPAPAPLERNTQQRRSRSRKRRPRDDAGSRDNSLSEASSQDIVVGGVASGVVGNDIDSPPQLQLAPPGREVTSASPKKKHASPLAQSSPQMQRHLSLATGDAVIQHPSFDSITNEIPAFDPYPVTPAADVSSKKRQKRNKSEDGSTRSRRRNRNEQPEAEARPKLVFEGVTNSAFEDDVTDATSAQPMQRTRRRKSGGRGKRSARGAPASIGHSNESMSYMDDSVETDKYVLSGRSSGTETEI